MEILKVSAKSNPNSVAGALAGVLREKGGAEIQAIGAGALNQAISPVSRIFVHLSMSEAKVKKRKDRSSCKKRASRHAYKE